MWKSRGYSLLFGLLVMLAGCTTIGEQPADQPESVSHDNMNAVLWMQTAAEYAGNNLGVYHAATRELPRVMTSNGITADINQAESYGCLAGQHCQALAQANLIPAVVLDIDETVLDNSAFQARLVASGAQWNPASWDLWVAEQDAWATPGALAFIRAAKAAGAAVVYITNRACAPRPESSSACPQKEDTVINLGKLGFPELDDDDRLILRAEQPDWDVSEKKSRRQHIAQQYRIGMLIGDDLGDLASDIKRQPIGDRSSFVQQHAELYGKYWFQLTNPTYGSWTGPFRDADKKSFLRE